MERALRSIYKENKDYLGENDLNKVEGKILLSIRRRLFLANIFYSSTFLISVFSAGKMFVYILDDVKTSGLMSFVNMMFDVNVFQSFSKEIILSILELTPFMFLILLSISLIVVLVSVRKIILNFNNHLFSFNYK